MFHRSSVSGTDLAPDRSLYSLALEVGVFFTGSDYPIESMDIGMKDISLAANLKS